MQPRKQKSRGKGAKAKAVNGSLVWSIRRAATEFGVSEETVRRGLAESGVAITERKAGNLTTRQVFGALAGDLKTERVLDLRRKRLAQERADRERDGDLLPKALVTELHTSALGPIRQRLLALPQECAGRCVGPEQARRVLQVWVDETLAQLRDDITEAVG